MQSEKKRLVTWLMLASLLVPLATTVSTVTVATTGPVMTVYAENHGGHSGGSHSSSKGHGHSSSGKSPKKDAKKDKGDKGKADKNSSSDSGASSTPKSDSGPASNTTQGNILDGPAKDLATSAAKDLTAPADSDKSDDASKKPSVTASVKGLIKSGALGTTGNPNIGNAWSFMASDNNAFWATNNQGDAQYDVSATESKNNGGAHYPSQTGKQAYQAMVEATHLPYIMNELGLDRSFAQGFNNQKHDTFQSWGANVMQLCYGITKWLHDMFGFVLQMLADLNPFNLILNNTVNNITDSGSLKLSKLQEKHFGGVASLLNALYNGGANFGKTLMVILFAFGIGLAAMGMQIGQSAKVSQGRGMLNAGITLLKRAFVIIALPIMLAFAYTDLMNLSKALFTDAGYAPGNYAIYSTMTSFQDMVSHGRLNFSPTFLDKGLLPNQMEKINDGRVTNAYLNHHSVIMINNDFGRSGAGALLAQTDGTDNSSVDSMFRTDPGAKTGDTTANNLLRDFTANRTYSASDYVSQITPGIPSKNGDKKEGTEEPMASDPSVKMDLTDLKAYKYSANGNLYANSKQFTAHSQEQGNDTASSEKDLALGEGGLSTIGMYNYLRSVTNLSSVIESSAYKHNNAVSDPQHFAVNFAGAGIVADANIGFALALMLSMAMISVGTIWFICKALFDSIPGSITGIIQGAMGSFAGGVRAVSYLVGFFISLGVTGVVYQLSFKSLIAFIGVFESFFGQQNATGDTLTSSAIRFFGLNGTAPTQVAGVVTLNASMFAAMTAFEAIMMIYIVRMFFKWRIQIIQALSAGVNSAFSRIMQSFGGITGAGSVGMESSGLGSLAQKAANAGIGNGLVGAKGMMSKAGTMLGMTNKNKQQGGLGNLAKGAAMAGLGGGATAMALKGLNSIANKENNQKSNAEQHHKKSDSQSSRQQAALEDLKARQGNPLEAMSDGQISASPKSQQALKDATKAQANDAMKQLDQYSDQGRMQALSNDMGGYHTPTEQQKALSQQPLDALGQHQMQAHPGVKAATAAQQQQLFNQSPMDALQAHNQAQHPGVKKAQEVAKQKQQAAENALDQVLQAVDGQGHAGSPGMQPLTDTNTMDSATASLAATSNEAAEVLAGTMPEVDSGQLLTDQQTMENPLTNSQANSLAKGMNKTFGTNVSGDMVQEATPMAEQALAGLDNVLDGGGPAAVNGIGAGQTITAVGNGQAVISNGATPAPLDGINTSTAYGKGMGVMPGEVPLGMNVNPAYTTSGAGVIHGGLNSALGNVQAASAQAMQATNAASVNPGNEILQSRATQAVQSQRQAQVAAMQLYNDTPVRQIASALVNSDTPSSVLTGQVNQAVKNVYDQQQAFKAAATKFGPQAVQTQQAAASYQAAITSAKALHIKSQILQQADFLKAANESVRKQQMSIMDGSFDL